MTTATPTTTATARRTVNEHRTETMNANLAPPGVEPERRAGVPAEFETELRLALAASRHQRELYRPTSFWARAALDIAEEILEAGPARFRRLPLPLAYFVPTYGPPGNGLDRGAVEALASAAAGAPKRELAVEGFASGHDAALADYRVLLAGDVAGVGPALHRFSESRVGDPIEQFTFDGRRFSRSSLNYLLGLCLLKRHLEPGERVRTVLEIGGGFGSLGEILLSGAEEGVRYVDLDIPPNSAVAQYYLSEAFGADRVATFAATRGRRRIDLASLPAASALCNWQIEALHGEVDLFVNFISFQEMEPAVVANYLRHVDRLGARWVLLRNLREGKQRRTGTSVGVECPIRSEDYLRMLPGYAPVATEVWPFGHRTVDGFHSELLLLRRREDRS